MMMMISSCSERVKSRRSWHIRNWRGTKGEQNTEEENDGDDVVQDMIFTSSCIDDEQMMREERPSSE